MNSDRKRAYLQCQLLYKRQHRKVSRSLCCLLMQRRAQVREDCQSLQLEGALSLPLRFRLKGRTLATQQAGRCSWSRASDCTGKQSQGAALVVIARLKFTRSVCRNTGSMCRLNARFPAALAGAISSLSATEADDLHKKAAQAALDLRQRGWASLEGILPR